MKKYTINVHYDYYASVEVVAENENEAIENAKAIADGLPMGELEFCDFTDACVCDECDA